MKKLAILGASAALAAMPVVGVFAADYQSVTDTVELIVQTSCNMRTGGTAASPTTTGSTWSHTTTPGHLVGDTGEAWGTAGSTVLTFNCNDAGGWKVTAQGVSGVSGDVTAQTFMKGASSGTNIATGEATSGPTSNWAFKVTGTNAVTNYTSFRAVPDAATPVATSTDAVTEATLTPSYRVWVSNTQKQDTYTGYVKYVLTAPAA